MPAPTSMVNVGPQALRYQQRLLVAADVQHDPPVDVHAHRHVRHAERCQVGSDQSGVGGQREANFSGQHQPVVCPVRQHLGPDRQCHVGQDNPAASYDSSTAMQFVVRADVIAMSIHFITWLNGNIYAGYQGVGIAQTWVWGFVSYDPIAHAYWRIREAGGTLFSKPHRMPLPGIYAFTGTDFFVEQGANHSRQCRFVHHDQSLLR